MFKFIKIILFTSVLLMQTAIAADTSPDWNQIAASNTEEINNYATQEINSYDTQQVIKQSATSAAESVSSDPNSAEYQSAYDAAKQEKTNDLYEQYKQEYTNHLAEIYSRANSSDIDASRTMYVNTKDEVDMYYYLFTDISFFFDQNSTTGEDYKSLLKLIFLFGALLTGLKMISMSTNEQSTTVSIMDFAKYQVLITSMLIILYGTGYKNLIIEHKDSLTFQVTPELPAIFVYSTAFFSNFQYKMTKLSERVFHNDFVSIPSGINIDNRPQPSYGYTGLGYGGLASKLEEVKNFDLSKIKYTDDSNGEVIPIGTIYKHKLSIYMSECVAKPLSLTPGGTEQLIKISKSKNVMDDIAPDEINNNTIPLEYEGNSTNCEDFYNNELLASFNTLRDAMDQSQNKRNDDIIDGLAYLNAFVTASNSQGQGELGDVAQIKSLLINTSATKEMNSMFEGIGAAGGVFASSSAAAIREQNINGLTTGKYMQKYLPYASSLLFAIMIAAFPLMFAFSLLPGGLSILLNYAKTLAWVSLWPPISAILNFFIDYRMTQAIGDKMEQTGADFNNFDLHSMSLDELTDVSSEAAIFAGLAGMLYISVPGLSWMLVTGSGVMLGNIAQTVGGGFKAASSIDAMGERAQQRASLNAINEGTKEDMSMQESLFYQQQSQVSGKIGSTSQGMAFDSAGASSVARGTVMQADMAQQQVSQFGREFSNREQAQATGTFQGRVSGAQAAGTGDMELNSSENDKSNIRVGARKMGTDEFHKTVGTGREDLEFAKKGGYESVDEMSKKTTEASATDQTQKTLHTAEKLSNAKQELASDLEKKADILENQAKKSIEEANKLRKAGDLKGAAAKEFEAEKEEITANEKREKAKKIKSGSNSDALDQLNNLEASQAFGNRMGNAIGYGFDAQKAQNVASSTSEAAAIQQTAATKTINELGAANVKQAADLKAEQEKSATMGFASAAAEMGKRSSNGEIKIDKQSMQELADKIGQAAQGAAGGAMMQQVQQTTHQGGASGQTHVASQTAREQAIMERERSRTLDKTSDGNIAHLGRNSAEQSITGGIQTLQKTAAQMGTSINGAIDRNVQNQSSEAANKNIESDSKIRAAGGHSSFVAEGTEHGKFAGQAYATEAKNIQKGEKVAAEKNAKANEMEKIDHQNEGARKAIEKEISKIESRPEMKAEKELEQTEQQLKQNVQNAQKKVAAANEARNKRTNSRGFWGNVFDGTGLSEEANKIDENLETAEKELNEAQSQLQAFQAKKESFEAKSGVKELKSNEKVLKDALNDVKARPEQIQKLRREARIADGAGILSGNMSTKSGAAIASVQAATAKNNTNMMNNVDNASNATGTSTTQNLAQKTGTDTEAQKNMSEFTHSQEKTAQARISETNADVSSYENTTGIDYSNKGAQQGEMSGQESASRWINASSSGVNETADKVANFSRAAKAELLKNGGILNAGDNQEAARKNYAVLSAMAKTGKINNIAIDGYQMDMVLSNNGTSASKYWTQYRGRKDQVSLDTGVTNDAQAAAVSHMSEGQGQIAGSTINAVKTVAEFAGLKNTMKKIGRGEGNIKDLTKGIGKFNKQTSKKEIADKVKINKEQKGNRPTK